MGQMINVLLKKKQCANEQEIDKSPAHQHLAKLFETLCCDWGVHKFINFKLLEFYNEKNFFFKKKFSCFISSALY